MTKQDTEENMQINSLSNLTVNKALKLDRLVKLLPKPFQYGPFNSLTYCLVVICMLLVFFTTLLLLGAFGPIPSNKDLANVDSHLAAEVYSADSVLLGRYYIENRLAAGLDEISPYVIQAAVATEDSRFYEHHGIDLRAWGRVLVKSVLLQNDESGGGSTITQQLAKNLYPRQRFWFFSIPLNKAREIVIATKLERIYTKDEIMALYLNTIPFSGNVFGIKTAAQRFFSKSPGDLNLEEAAVLIGMLKATTAYHPLLNPDRSLERRNTVLARMEKQGFLDCEEMECLQALPLVLHYKVRTHNDGIATYFREHLRLDLEEELQHLSKPDGSPYNLYTDGLRIFTTIDSRLQRHAEAAVAMNMRNIQDSYYAHFKKHKEALPYGSYNLLQQQVRATERYRQWKELGWSKTAIDSAFKKPVEMTVFNWKTGGEQDTLLSPLDSLKYYLSLLNTGFLAVDPHTGGILAWVGGINFKHFKYDHVKSRRQVGSTFKPVLYAQALESGINPCKRFENKYVVYDKFDGWAPRNVNNEYGGSYNMEGALKKSVNTIAVQVILKVGVGPVKELAYNMGVTSPIPHEAGIALGAVDLSLYEMVNVFSTIANHGRRPKLHGLLRIETADGKPIQEIQPPKPESFFQALSEKHADMMTYLLTRVVDGGGTASRLRSKYNVKGNIAAKTGTSNDNRDGWFLGFTPNIAMGAWVGGEQQLIRFQDTKLGQGSSTAMPICAKFLNEVYEDANFEKWQKEKFPPLDSVTMDILDCQSREIAKDTARVDSVVVEGLLGMRAGQ
ncbi:MAG: transglycosylase domain-containing protein [Saprospiraceae bacterium]